jgi:hypothetical protein
MKNTPSPVALKALLKYFNPIFHQILPACHAGGREFESRPDRKRPLNSH